MKHKYYLLPYFHFYRNERRGILVLVIICLAWIYGYKSIKSHRQNDPTMEQEAITQLVNLNQPVSSEVSATTTIVAALTSDDKQKIKPKSAYFEKKREQTQPKTSKITSNKYVNTPVKPKKTNDYNRLPAKKVLPFQSIDINKATVEEWQQLKGIGTVYANRIVKFRSYLGGFSTIEQIADTYNLPDSTFQSIRVYLKSSKPYQFLNINELDASALVRHPYITWRQANAIVNYRKNHGPFPSKEKLSEVKVFTSIQLQKILPYIIVQ